MTFAVGMLHQATWHWHVAAWGVVLLFLFAGWVGSLVVASIIHRAGRGDALDRSLFPFGHAMGVLVLAVVLFRIYERIDTDFGPGPQHWLLGWIPRPVVPPNVVVPDLIHPYDTLVVVNVLGAGLAAATMLLAALVDPPGNRKPLLNRPVPGAPGATVILLLCVAFLPWLFHRAYGPDTDAWWLLDWVGLAPLLGVCAAGRLFAYVPPEEADIGPTEEAPAPYKPPDIEAAWRAAGVLAEDAVPILETPGTPARVEEPTQRALHAWEAVVGPGLPPAALDTLIEELPGSDEAILVGDLPAETEALVQTALLADLVGVGGQRALVITPRPAERAADLAEALHRARTWDPGHVAVGTAALQEAIARHRLPMVVFVHPHDLSEGLIRVAATDARGFTRGLSLLIVHRPDQGRPIEATHLALTFRRWHLATSPLTRPPVLVFGPDTSSMLGHVEALFPGRRPRRLPLQPRSPGQLRALPAQGDPTQQSDPWVARAARAVLDTGEPVTVVDPMGRWGAAALAEPGAKLYGGLTWPDRASVADLDIRSLAEAYCSAAHRLDVPASETHLSLWNVARTPVTRFLMLPGRLETLHGRKDLPTPAPVIGDHNRFLRLAHLTAALYEGSPHELALRRAFGDDVVDFMLRQLELSEQHAAFVDGGVIVRSPVVRPPAGAPREEPRSDTVTTDVVAIVDERSGDTLATVDARVAATHYYPKRVFTHENRRFRVPLHTLDTKRKQLRVVPAGATDQVTRPLLRFELTPRRTVVDRVTRRQGKLTVHTWTIDALVKEEVLAAWVPGEDVEERFDPVHASYDGQVRLIYPDKAEAGSGLFHLARSFDDVLPAHLRINTEDVEVVPVHPGLVPGEGAGIAVIDRHVGGMGVASTLHDGVVIELLRWVRAILFECSCMNGCARCTPEQVLKVGPAKQDVLKMLEG